MKTYWGSGSIAPRILDLGTRWRYGQIHAPVALPPGKEPPGTRWIEAWSLTRSWKKVRFQVALLTIKLK